MRRHDLITRVTMLCAIAGTVTACTGAPSPPSAAAAPTVAEQCHGTGTGLSAAVTPATRKALDDERAMRTLPLEEIYERVARGESAAQVELGLRLMNGTGVTPDPARAVRLFEAASAQGNPVGTFFLGTAYVNGLGVDGASDSQAVVLWEQAAREGHPLSQYWLGFMIANGRGGIERSWCAAVPLFEAAALEHVPDASFMLGFAYHTGELGPPDYKKAAEWYRRATAKELNQKAQYNLRILIEQYLVDWQEGDPGQPPPPKPAAGESEAAPAPAAANG
jgi:TPR repeat protein